MVNVAKIMSLYESGVIITFSDYVEVFQLFLVLLVRHIRQIVIYFLLNAPLFIMKYCRYCVNVVYRFAYIEVGFWQDWEELYYLQWYTGQHGCHAYLTVHFEDVSI